MSVSPCLFSWSVSFSKEEAFKFYVWLTEFWKLIRVRRLGLGLRFSSFGIDFHTSPFHVFTLYTPVYSWLPASITSDFQSHFPSIKIKRCSHDHVEIERISDILYHSTSKLWTNFHIFFLMPALEFNT